MKAKRARPTRQYLIDTLEALQRKPHSAPTVPDTVAISAALTMFVPGPASLVSPNGLGVRLIKLALDRTGYEIVPRHTANARMKEPAHTPAHSPKP